jgi:predicted phosphate transport protein (TIGR00153 family)
MKKIAFRPVTSGRIPRKQRRPLTQTTADFDPAGRSTMANVLANIFGKSPVEPLEKHVNIAYRCTRELIRFFAAVVKEDWDAANVSRDKIAALEHQADNLKKKIRLRLPKSLFMPVPREDLLELLLVQDKMANRTKDVSGIVIGRKMKIPAAIADDFLEFVSRNVDAAKQARKSVRELDELFTTGFRGAEVSLVESMIEELDRIETDTDDRQAALRGALFEIEEQLEPVNVIFLYRVIELTGEIADMAERVGRRLELLLSH